VNFFKICFNASMNVLLGLPSDFLCSHFPFNNLYASPAEAKDFSSSLCVQTSSDAHPAFYSMSTGGSFPGDKAWLGRDADHSTPSSTESRVERAILPLPLGACMAVAVQLYFLLCPHFPTCATHPATLIVLNVITHVLFGEE
jgi:hypothetical protein